MHDDVKRALSILDASRPHLATCDPLECARELIVQALDMLPDDLKFYALTDALIELNDRPEVDPLRDLPKN